MKLIKKFKPNEVIPNRELIDDDFIYENSKGKFVFLNEINKKHLSIENTEYNILKKDEINYYGLRDYQKIPLNHIFKHNKVILNLPIRYGKTYISITAAMNVKGNRIFFIDKIMLKEFKNIIKNEFNFEGEVYIYHNKENEDLFTRDIKDSFILTTEETFLARYKKFGEEEKNFIKTIHFAVFDEYHNFIKNNDSRYRELKSIFDKKILNPSFLIFLSASPINQEIDNSFKVMNLIDGNFIYSPWLKKFFKLYIDKYGHYKKDLLPRTKEKLKEMIGQVFYNDENIKNPFDSLIFEKIFIEQNEELIFLQNKEKNYVSKQKISDDYRIHKETSMLGLGIPKKNEKAISIIKENINKKIVIITHFKESQEKLKEDLTLFNIESEIINSNINLSKRFEIINNFQNGSLNVVILQKDTAIGITLSKGDISIIISATYQPQVFYQSAGRIIDTDINNLTFKKVYWLLDKNFDSSVQEILFDKQQTLLEFGFNYSPSDQDVIKIIFESKEDAKFIKRMICPELNVKGFNKNEFNISEKTLKSIDKILKKYIFIVDNDEIIENLKLKENNIKYLTFNKLFGVDDSYKTIEKILHSLNVYDDEDLIELNLFQKCNFEGSLLKEIFNKYENKKIQKEILKEELFKFEDKITKISTEDRNKIKSKIEYELKKIEDDIYISKSNINKFNSISGYIKTIKMRNIKDDFFINENLRKKCKENIIKEINR